MQPPPVQTKTLITQLLREAAILPRRRLGQNFLIDGNLMRLLVTSADLQPDDTVLEVGAGTGALTEQLAPRAARVITVEIDRRLHPILEQRLEPFNNVTLLRTDALASKHRLAPELVAALRAARAAGSGRLLLVANLPYAIATPLLANLLLEPARIERFCFTVQKELADRFQAAPGTKQYGPFSIVLQAVCRITRLAKLPPAVFWPQPKVDSTMLRLDLERTPFDSLDRLAAFMHLLRAGFAHRRKTLAYNLSLLSPDASDRLKGIVDPSERPERIGVETWIELANHLPTLRT